MKILVVGGAGYIGGYLVDNLLSNNYDVSVFDNLTYERQFFKDVDFIYGDIRDTNKIKEVIKEKKFDNVIWLAALVGDGACSINETITYEINVNSIRDFIEFYDGDLIFISTCSVYGKSNVLLDENAEKNPLSVYAKSKIIAEKILSKRQNTTVIRLGTLFGLSDLFSRIRLDLVVNILTLKAANKEKISVFGGEQYRPLLHVKDVSNALVHIIKNQIYGTFNVSYNNYKIIDVAKIISDSFDYKVQLNINNQQFEDTRNYRVSSKKFFETGWKNQFNLNYGIEELKKIFLSNRIKNYQDEVFSNYNFLKINKL